jgi:hypothetical protein
MDATGCSGAVCFPSAAVPQSRAEALPPNMGEADIRYIPSLSVPEPSFSPSRTPLASEMAIFCHFAALLVGPLTGEEFWSVISPTAPIQAPISKGGSL